MSEKASGLLKAAFDPNGLFAPALTFARRSQNKRELKSIEENTNLIYPTQRQPFGYSSKKTTPHTSPEPPLVLQKL